MYHMHFSSHYAQIFIVTGILYLYLIGEVLSPRITQGTSSHILKMTVPITALLKCDPE